MNASAYVDVNIDCDYVNSACIDAGAAGTITNAHKTLVPMLLLLVLMLMLMLMLM